ncbi:MAG: bifunctional diaminohydroxyphosphoribosylaminopyrimidine deaminase/5-amino-6-(5-phosphoribosylamino)uracil reductase RibD [Thermoanaerobaculia bacterium]
MTDERLMRRALELAETGRYTVSPNPMVGCVIARDGRVIGEGFHHHAGGPHAEVEALRACTESPANADVYLTLEPCAHFGRTPPCADALVDAKVGRVVAAIEDPQAEVAGRGFERLRERGIEVEVGLCAEEAERLNEKFLFAERAQRPFLLLKAGMTLDGKLATIARRSRWITSEASRERSLLLREEYDAILVGSGTIAADDPQLTRRLGRSEGRTPWTRIVVDAVGEVPAGARVLQDGDATVLFTASEGLAPAHPRVEIVRLPAAGGRIDLALVLTECWKRGIRSVIAEGGSLLHAEIVEKSLWQKMVLFVAPAFVGGGNAPSIFAGAAVRDLTEAHRFRFDRFERVGPDLMIVAYPD